MKALVKDVVLFVNTASAESLSSLQKYAKQLGYPIFPAIIFDQDFKTVIDPAIKIKLPCRYNRPASIIKTLKPYQARFLAVVCGKEKSMVDFACLVPHLPALKTPSEEALFCSTNKIAMRQKLESYDANITPKFMDVRDAKKATIQEIITKLNFPIVVKPANLSMSLLVSFVSNETELNTVLRQTFKNIAGIYQENYRREAPSVLVEQFMAGEMYSIDVYIDMCGRIKYCPFVEVKTGRSVGFDDFFGYCLITPALSNKALATAARAVAAQGIKALGLFNTTAHIELMSTANGFKIIEVGARVGGYRHKMYQLSFGVDHALNDILVRIPRPLSLPDKIKGYTAVLDLYAKQEGILKSIVGLNKIKKLKSFVSIKIKKSTGDYCAFAKHGGKSVINIFLFNKNKSTLLADVASLESLVAIKII
ncbi:hypothetical protein COT94_02850 [Candidatus Falkowbacteria bacterium CG10_big_fil_rev_8_21_14_0_10_37_14]|uniref:ATP-grasp domain-containing protein n=1 Tax=Candidatus Falkowbacteria bacterium CG10_big_fil_rev_8_21_14_0_10_37_14 TaxID=1974561 RepID=A0A2M6WT21_9BACT|nr:ATP-grasp domain-containing protein [Candidatus Falkowbacteria bacterium]PIT95963.1 MAG: hypothetical protein COT94_02850 [Candidatus Falkowbacteria bacterium CG10_big_fil_rev_8_21_14_0_10_37_14]